jgi:hypothetical protein
MEQCNGLTLEENTDILVSIIARQNLMGAYAEKKLCMRNTYMAVM